MNIQTTLNNAVTAHQQGDISAARSLYKKILRTKPLHFDALHLLGVIYFNEKRLQESRQYIKRALVVNSEFAEAHFNLGNTLVALGELIEAKESYQKAIAIKPDYIEAHSNLGTVLCSLCDSQLAQETYENALQIAPSTTLWFNYGNVLADQKLYEKAKDAFKHVISLDPQQYSVWDALGTLYADQGRYQDALPCYEKAILLSPEFAGAHSNMSYVMFSTGQLDVGLLHAKKALELDPNCVSALINLGSALILMGSFAEATICLEKANVLDPNFVKCITALGRLRCLLGDWPSAMKYYFTSFSLDSENQGLEDGVYLAILFYLSNDLDAAQNYLVATKIAQHGQLAVHKAARAYWLLLDKLLQYDNPKIEVSSLNRLYVIGESHSLPYSNRVVKHHNQAKLCQSLWIVGCKQWHLGNALANQYKVAVQHHFQSIPKCSAVLMAIGEIDCRSDEGIVAFIHKNPDEDLVQVTNKTISMYLDWLLMTNSETQHQIIVSGVPASNINLDELVLISKSEFTGFLATFNEVLMQESLKRGFQFLDVYAMTNQGDGTSNGKWHIDEFHLKPSAIPVLFNDHYIQAAKPI